jgi:phosphoserine phosphatase RsbU/P
MKLTWPEEEYPTAEFMHCMEVRGGNSRTNEVLDLSGLRLWVYSKPHGGAEEGGDVYYLSSCSSGRITRALLADVSGHGSEVSPLALDLRDLMRENINIIDQTRLVHAVNRKFSEITERGGFATASIWTYFEPNRSLRISNAGHPSPLLYRNSSANWLLLEQVPQDLGEVSDIPLGILGHTGYSQIDIRLEPHDLLLLCSDALTDAMDSSGKRLGLGGLKQMVSGMVSTEPQSLIYRLLENISAQNTQNLQDDDVTILLAQVKGAR